jgi:serine/threonine protein kinase
VKDEPSGGRPFGTLPYMAPEAIEGHGRPADRQADIYALGVIFYELLTGRLPFTADNTAELTRQILSGELRAPRAFRPEIPEGLQAVCMKCLTENPANRYATAGELAQALRSLLGRRLHPVWKAATVLLGVCVIVTAVVVVVPAMLRLYPQANTSTPSSPAVPFLANVNLVQFHPLQREIYVLDPHVTEIRYSLDGMNWKKGQSFRIQGLAVRWATAAVANEDVQRLVELAKSGQAKLWVRYTNDRGVESAASELTLDASKFRLPVEIPKVELPKGLPGVGGVTQP